jgi:hypothetical protein
MVTKAKPATEAEVKTEEPEPKETVEITDDALTEKIKAVVESMLPGGSTEEPAGTEVDDSKPLTAREEEARTHNIVAEAIKGFLDELKGDEKEEPAKKEPETKPGAQPVRWIEKHLWGAE